VFPSKGKMNASARFSALSMNQNTSITRQRYSLTGDKELFDELKMECEDTLAQNISNYSKYYS
jgi:hypothetical protein